MAINKDVFLSPVGASLFDKIDFADTYTTTNHLSDIKEIAYMMFGTSPKWVMTLLNFRNMIARFFGLKTEIPEDAMQAFEVGAYLKFFEIYEIHDNEVVLGADDKHLNFRVIVTKTDELENNVKCTTIVEYQNKLGKYYMGLIKPGHKYICNLLVKQAYSPLKNEKEKQVDLLFT